MKKLCRLTTYVKTYFYNILKYFFTWKNEFKYICKYVIFLLLTFLYASNPSACWSLKWKVFPCLRWMDWLKRACRILPLEYQKSSSVPVYFWAYLNINNSGLQILQINPRMWRAEHSRLTLSWKPRGNLARSRPLAPHLSLLFSMKNHQGIMCLSPKWHQGR